MLLLVVGENNAAAVVLRTSVAHLLLDLAVSFEVAKEVALEH